MVEYLHTSRYAPESKGDTTMLTKTKIALAAAVILSTASGAWASDSGENHQDNDRATVSTTNAGANAYGFAVSPKQTHRPSHQQTKNR
jgi:hypothetical protein